MAVRSCSTVAAQRAHGIQHAGRGRVIGARLHRALRYTRALMHPAVNITERCHASRREHHRKVPEESETLYVLQGV